MTPLYWVAAVVLSVPWDEPALWFFPGVAVGVVLALAL